MWPELSIFVELGVGVVFVLDASFDAFEGNYCRTSGGRSRSPRLSSTATPDERSVRKRRRAQRRA